MGRVADLTAAMILVSNVKMIFESKMIQEMFKVNRNLAVSCQGEYNWDCPPSSFCEDRIGRCACFVGFYTVTNTSCVDMDECSFVCKGAGRLCDNTWGGFFCYCQKGYEDVDDTCVDVNECEDPESCGENMDCTNTHGSFRCECHGRTVERTGTCAAQETDAYVCPPKSMRLRVDLGVYCKCKAGYVQTSSTSCSDMDECFYHPCDLDTEECENTVGSFLCRCKTGFRFDARRNCTDVDECKEIGAAACSHGPLETCRNTPGSFECMCRESGGTRGSCETMTRKEVKSWRWGRSRDKEATTMMTAMVSTTLIILFIVFWKEKVYEKYQKRGKKDKLQRFEQFFASFCFVLLCFALFCFVSFCFSG